MSKKNSGPLITEWQNGRKKEGNLWRHNYAASGRVSAEFADTASVITWRTPRMISFNLWKKLSRQGKKSSCHEKFIAQFRSHRYTGYQVFHSHSIFLPLPVLFFLFINSYYPKIIHLPRSFFSLTAHSFIPNRTFPVIQYYLRTKY